MRKYTATRHYDLSGISVLIVEDNRFTQKILREILSALRVGCIECHDDAVSALQAMTHKDYDVVFVDWDMPLLDGRDFTRTVRTDAALRHAHVPIVMVTASNDRRHVLEARDAGVNEFLAKPVSAAAIYSHLAWVIEKPRPFVRTRTYVGPCRRRSVSLDYGGPDRRRGNETANGKDIGNLLARVAPH